MLVCFFYYLITVPSLQGPYIIFSLGKEKGYMTTLPAFLKDYTQDDELRREYKACDKETLFTDFENAKKVKACVPKRSSNVAISKLVYMKLDRVIASVCLSYFLDPFLTSFQCNELNQIFGTEVALFYSRGNDSHTYSPGRFVTEGAQKWVESAEIGNNHPDSIATQLEGFIISGCAGRVNKLKKTKEGRYCTSISTASDGT